MIAQKRQFKKGLQKWQKLQESSKDFAKPKEYKFSKVDVYINNQQIHISNRLYSHKSYISNNFKGATSEYKGVLQFENYDCEEFPEEVMEAHWSEQTLQGE